MAINRINETDLQGKLVSQLSNRPTDPRSSGGDNMTAQQVKARHDALGLLVKDKLNEFIDALNNATVDGEPVTPLSDLITVVADNVSKSLTEWIEAKLTKNATAGEGVHAYGVDNAGVQTMLSVKDTPTAGAIPQYGTGGVLPVADGTADGHAVAKGQMATAISSAINDLSTTLTALINAKYTKPDGGIPKADLSSEVKSILENAEKVLTAANYSAVVTMLNAAAKTDYKVGQKILIGAGRVPDLWIYFVHEAAVTYTYTTDLAFQTALENGTLQIGYYALRPLEAKTELEDYPTKTEMNSAISGNIDATLSTTGKSADAKAVGDAIDALIDALVDGVMAVAEAAYAESATYAQQADFANQINTDREIEDADTACPPTVFGTVGGNAEVQSGLMKFPEIHGHTIKWNQLVQNGNFASTVGWAGPTYGTWSISDGKASYTVTVVGDDSQNRIATALTKFVADHKYLICCTVTPPANKSYTISTAAWGNDHHIFTPATIGTVSSRGFVGVIVTSAYSESTQLRFTMGSVSKAVGDVIVFENCECFDLTDIYGAGNEPSTVSEFLASFPKPYYPYNAGTLLSSKSSSVDFSKRNQWDEEWETGTLDENGEPATTSANVIRSKNFCECFANTVYFLTRNNHDSRLYWYDANKNFISRNDWGTNNQTYTTPANARYFKIIIAETNYNHDICFYINWDTPGLPYVPYSKQHITLPNLELRSAGSAYDVLYQHGGGKRRIGSYTFTGNETWTASSGHAYYTNAITTLVKAPSSNEDVANILCDALDATSSNDLYSYGNTTRGIAINTGGYIWIDETTYASIASLTGKTLYYELATETDITLEENPGWTEYAEIDNFGTVKFNQDPAQDIPVPQAYFVRYVVNLVEFLDSLFVHCGGDVSKIALVE